MEKEDIIQGLKNALERGYSLALAKQSFINAGYNPRDVEAAAREISGGIITEMPANQPNQQIQPVQYQNGPQLQKSFQQLSQPNQQVQRQPLQLNQMQFQSQQPPRSRKSGLIIFLIILLLVLLGALLATIFFKDVIIEFINSTFSQ